MSRVTESSLACCVVNDEIWVTAILNSFHHDRLLGKQVRPTCHLKSALLHRGGLGFP